LAVGRQHQALHMILLGWEKEFDEIDTRCLECGRSVTDWRLPSDHYPVEARVGKGLAAKGSPTEALVRWDLETATQEQKRGV